MAAEKTLPPAIFLEFALSPAPVAQCRPLCSIGVGWGDFSPEPCFAQSWPERAWNSNRRMCERMRASNGKRAGTTHNNRKAATYGALGSEGFLVYFCGFLIVFCFKKLLTKPINKWTHLVCEKLIVKPIQDLTHFGILVTWAFSILCCHNCNTTATCGAPGSERPAIHSCNDQAT